MKFPKIKVSVPKSLSFNVMKNKPDIYLVTTIASYVCSTCYAWTQSRKVQDKLKISNEKLKELRNKPQTEEVKKEIMKEYAKLGCEVVKSSLPVAISFAAGTAGACGVHKVMADRNLALSSAYAAMTTAFNGYRKRVQEKLGTEEESKLRLGTKEETDQETGEVKQKNDILPGDQVLIFDKGYSELWTSNQSINKMSLEARESEANIILRSDGILTYNQVADMLGYKRTKTGQYIGWVYSKDKPCHVSFGLEDPVNDSFRRGLVNRCVITLNMQGYILDDAVKIGVLDK